MSFKRKGGLLMLIAAVLWTALPVSACLLTARSMGMSTCCRGMAQDCPMRGMDMNSSCCQMHGESFAAVPDILLSPEHGHNPALAPYRASVESAVILNSASRSYLEPPPADISPGRSSILRI
ncbi:MAG: hypothetical protein WBE72_22795 [Terracidiphilus sp.]